VNYELYSRGKQYWRISWYFSASSWGSLKTSHIDRRTLILLVPLVAKMLRLKRQTFTDFNP
jgi:hypothetical protein